MENQKDIINKLIPADDLFWDDIEQRYTVHSLEEIDAILEACLNNNLTEEDSIMKVLQWCTSIRTGELLMKHFLAGNVGIVDLDKNGEPLFVQLPEINT